MSSSASGFTRSGVILSESLNQTHAMAKPKTTTAQSSTCARNCEKSP
jgi:hypothetical protein